MGDKKKNIFRDTEIMKVKFIEAALNLDKKRTLTHPIQVVVKHTVDAANLCEEICYDKGVCFLQTLRH
jgi:aminopeptidase N